MAARVHRVCSHSAIPTERRSQWAWNRCKDVGVCLYVCVCECVRLHCAMNPLLFPECDRGLGAEPECLGIKSICCYVAASVRRVVCLFFYLPLIR